MQKITLLLSILAILISSYSLYMDKAIQENKSTTIDQNLSVQNSPIPEIATSNTGIIYACDGDVNCTKLDSINKAYTENNPNECKSLQDPKMIATCMDHISFIKAVESKDIGSCKKINEKSTQEDCETYIKSTLNNASPISGK